MAGVHAARMITPIHPVPYLHISEMLQTTETIKVGQESFIMGQEKKVPVRFKGASSNPYPPPVDTSLHVHKYC